MAIIEAPENTPVWVDTSRCKACDICVSVCPAGVLSMQPEPSSTLGGDD
jgi:2-oxoglutarate ferredoxin oxidoreductase subunit delta